MARRRKPEIDLLPAGTVLLRTSLRGRAVPWQVSTVTKNGAFKDRRLVAWQEQVQTWAWVNRTQSVAYAGPVEVSVVARFAKGPLPDATNVLKAIEDALQGPVFINDRQVMRNSCERTRTGYDWVTIEVKAYAEEG